jgi:hypothetical protein
VFVNYRYLEQRSIITNRMCLARAIENYGFPKPYALGANRLSGILKRCRPGLPRGPGEPQKPARKSLPPKSWRRWIRPRDSHDQ